MIEALNQRVSRINVNPCALSDETLAELLEVAKSKQLSFPIRIALGVFVGDEIKRRAQPDDCDEPMEISFFTIDLFGMNAAKLSAALSDAFSMMLARDSVSPEAADVLGRLAASIVGFSRGRLEKGF